MILFKFTDFVWEVWTLSVCKKVSIEVAYDMLKADIRNGKATEKNTSDFLPTFDYKLANKNFYDAVNQGVIAKSYDHWNKIIAYAKDDLDKVFPNRNEMDKITLKIETEVLKGVIE